MEKVCIFCGQRPINKTREHIIPKWLIELTGNPKRFGFFGFYKKDEDLKEMHLSFDRFTFPACKECNDEFSKLEASTKPVIIGLLEEKPLDDKEINLILTWLDKVRIGLWIGSLYYNNLFGINPKFYISQGAFTRDRMLILYKNNYSKKRLNFIGVHHVFQMLPICFTLIINNYAFTNIAKIFLLSKGFGLAVPKQEYILPSSNPNLIKFIMGSQEINNNIVDFNFEKKCTEFYQPILNKTYLNWILPKLNDEHKKIVFKNAKAGIGYVFYNSDGKIMKYPSVKKDTWIPTTIDMPFLEFFRLIGMQTLEIQNYYFEMGTRMYDPKLESEFQSQKKIALHVNNILKERLYKRDFKEFKLLD